MTSLEPLIPDWPAPPRVRAAFTTRSGGVSTGAFDSLNVAMHVGDDPAAVARNRERVREALNLPADPSWLEQVHGTDVADLDQSGARGTPRADAAISREAGRVCVIQVADCMPVLFAARDGSGVAAAHAGWRGLAGGILEATVGALAVPPGELIAWLGPAIGPRHFEVGEEVRAAFMGCSSAAAASFVRNPRGRWQCDLYALARLRLSALGVGSIYGGLWCTFAEPARFYSYRRDGQCGRMGAFIWLGP